MSQRCVLVRCRDCGGTGIGKEAFTQCEYCLGQMHINVDRTKDGGVPDGYTEWREIDLGPVPLNPLTLRTDATR